MTGGSGVRGKAGPIWVRKIFNCLRYLYYSILMKSIKQSQFLKLPPQPCVKSRDESNEVFDRMTRG
jgi:hypothetical protein